MALFTIYNAVKPPGDKNTTVANQQGGTLTPIRAINIAPISSSPTKVDTSGPSTVITIKAPEGSPITTSLNSASINASLNAALSTASLNTSPTSTTSTKTSYDNSSAASPGSLKDMSLNDSSQSDSSPGKYTHSEPWQKAEVWRYFSLTEDPVNGRRTICKLCGKGLSYNVRTTSTMRNHMKKKHPEIVIHNIMKPRRPRVPRAEFIPSYVLSTTARIGNKADGDGTQIGSGTVTIKDEPEDKDENDEGITSEYIDNLLGTKQINGTSSASAVASAKGTTLSQALQQARAPPTGRSVLRMIRPAPPKPDTTSVTTSTVQPTVTVRAVTSQPQFTIPAPAGITQPAFPGLTPILAAAPQGSTATAKVAQAIVRQPPPLRPAPGITSTTNVAPTRTNPVGTLTLPLTVGSNVVRPLLIAPQGDSSASTLGPQIAQTFSLRDVVNKTVDKGATTSTPVSTANRRSRTPVRIGPASPIIISPTPSPDVDDDNEKTAQPEFKSWRHRQSADKKELVNRLRDTLFKFCEDNLEYSKCLHIRGDVLVVYDDDCLSAEFDKHLHGDEITKDKRVRSQNEVARAKIQAQRNQNRQQPVAIQPIIQSVTSLATTSAPTTKSVAVTQSGARTSSAVKRAAGLDRILGSWYARPEEGSNDSDADSVGVGQDDPADTDWFPPAKKARGLKRKSSVPTRIIKQSQLVPSEDELDEDMQTEDTSSINSQETPADETQNQQDANAEGSQVENRAAMVIPITIAPESDSDEDEEDNRTTETTNNEGNTDQGDSEMNSVADSDEDDADDVLLIDESERNEQEKETENQAEESKGENDAVETGSLDSEAAETGSQNSDTTKLRKLVNIVNGDVSESNETDKVAEDQNIDADTMDEENEKSRPTENNIETDKETVEKNGAQEEEEMKSDDEFSDEEEGNVAPETVNKKQVNYEDDDASENVKESEKAARVKGKMKTRKDTNDNEKSGENEEHSAKGSEMVNGNATEDEKKGDKQKDAKNKDTGTRDRSGERNKKPAQFTIQTRKKSTDSRTVETRKSAETKSTPTKTSPAKAKGKQENKTQKVDSKPVERDSRIAPVERPNTRRLSRRITREDDDFVT